MSSLFGDPSRGVDKVAGDDVDLKKLTKKPTEHPKGEEIIEGVTNDSIDKFVKSQNEPQDAPKPNGFLDKLRRFIAGTD